MKNPSSAAAYALVVLAPLLAWLVWVSWGEGGASDAMHVAWFATVAVACTGAGTLAPRGPAHLLALAGLAIASTIATLFWWWSSEDSSGLFLVGIIIATPLVSLASVPLLLLGRRLSRAPQESAR